MLIIEIHRAKEMILYLNELAQIILTHLPISKELQKQMLNRIDDIKAVLAEAKLKEERKDVE